MRYNRGNVRSLLFLHYQGRGRGPLGKRLEKALMLIGAEHRDVLYAAHVDHVEPFPRKAEQEAADALLRAFELLGPAITRT